MSEPKKRLLRDVLHDENYAAFREALWQDIQGELRREQRRLRFDPRVSIGLALAACVMVGLGVFAWVQGGLLGKRPVGRSYEVVRTMPLEPGQKLRTQPISVGRVETKPGDARVAIGEVALVKVSTGEVELGMERISDGALVNLFAGHALALVDVGGHRALWFLDAADETRFFPGAHEANP